MEIPPQLMPIQTSLLLMRLKGQPLSNLLLQAINPGPGKVIYANNLTEKRLYLKSSKTSY